MPTHQQAGPQDCCVLTPAQHKVVALLSAGSTIAATARAAGVHRNTVALWRRRPDVQAALHQATQTQESLVRGQADAGAHLRAALAFLERQGLSDSMHAVHSSAQSESLVTRISETKPIPKIDVIAPPACDPVQTPHNPARTAAAVTPLKIDVIPAPAAVNAVHPPHNSAQPDSPVAKISGTNPIPKIDVIAQPSCGSVQSPHNLAQPAAAVTPVKIDVIPSPAVNRVHPAHNPAQSRETERTNPIPAAVRHPKVGRNQPCPCGSGKKFKRCCRAAPAA